MLLEEHRSINDEKPSRLPGERLTARERGVVLRAQREARELQEWSAEAETRGEAVALDARAHLAVVVPLLAIIERLTSEEESWLDELDPEEVDHLEGLRKSIDREMKRKEAA